MNGTENSSASATETLKEKWERKAKQRFKWLDQFRGLVIVLFTIQTLAWKLNGKAFEGDIPIIPPWVNHGYRYANFFDIPLITLIDLGEAIFMFLVGFMQAFSVIRRSEKGMKRVWMHVIIRFAILFGLNVVVVSFDGIAPWDEYIFNGVLIRIAWGTLTASVIAVFVKKGDVRLGIGAAILILHSILFGIDRNMSNVPFTTINLIAVAIVATAFTAWMFDDERQVTSEQFKSRIIPVFLFSFVIAYVLNFIQPADHHGATTAQQLLAIGTSGLALYAFYKINEDGFRIPWLGAFGKNMLLMFLLEMLLIEVIYLEYLGDLAGMSMFVDIILFGILPLVILWAIAKLFEKNNWILKI